MAVEVFAVGQHAAAGRSAAAVETVHERTLSRAAGAEQTDELAGLHHEVDIVEQLAHLAAGERDGLLQMACLQPDALAAVEGVDDAAGQREEEWADADALALADENRLGDALAADRDAVDAAEVAKAEPFRQSFEQGVIARHHRVR